MMPIEWHEECLRSSTRMEERYKDSAELARCTYERCRENNRVLAQQIARAKREGRKEFDAEKYGVAKNKGKKS